MPTPNPSCDTPKRGFRGGRWGASLSSAIMSCQPSSPSPNCDTVKSTPSPGPRSDHDCPHSLTHVPHSLPDTPQLSLSCTPPPAIGPAIGRRPPLVAQPKSFCSIVASQPPRLSPQQPSPNDATDEAHLSSKRRDSLSSKRQRSPPER